MDYLKFRCTWYFLQLDKILLQLSSRKNLVKISTGSHYICMQSQVDKTGWISALVGHHKGFSVFLSLYNFCMLNSAKVAKNHSYNVSNQVDNQEKLRKSCPTRGYLVNILIFLRYLVMVNKSSAYPTIKYLLLRPTKVEKQPITTLVLSYYFLYFLVLHK